MKSNIQPKDLIPRPITTKLVAIALALVAVFIATLLPQLLPPRLLDPQWQLTLCGVMAENGVLPLMALGAYQERSPLAVLRSAPHES